MFCTKYMRATLIIVALACRSFALEGPPVGTLDSEGWTNFTESPDSKIVYVSSSQGDDTNDGLSPAAPVKTLFQACFMVRFGFPDWILLRKGDTWVGETFFAPTSGRSAQEPKLISTYGSGPRPVIDSEELVAINAASSERNHIAVVGIEFRNCYFRWVSPATNLLVEDCYFGRGDMVIQASTTVSNVAIRRCVVVDSYSTTSHSQGLFCKGINGLLIEENVFDHNGWNDSVVGAEPTIYNHNIYIQVDNIDVTVRKNILMRASSHGLQARPGGVVEDNLFVGNPLALSFGYVLGTTEPTPGGVDGAIRRNVILDGVDIDRSGADPALRRGVGMQIGNIKASAGVVIEGNIIAHDKSAGVGPTAIQLNGTNGVGIQRAAIQNNLVYNWRRPMNTSGAPGQFLVNLIITNNMFLAFDDNQSLFDAEDGVSPLNIVLAENHYYNPVRNPANWFRIINQQMSFDEWVVAAGETESTTEEVQFVNPSLSLDTYQQSLDKSGGIDEFAAEARLQSRGNWRPEYTAEAVNAYFRAGFTAIEPEPVIIDIDGDEFHDPYEQVIIDFSPSDAFDSLDDVFPGDDFDGDGITNYDEFYRFLTDPTEANTAPILSRSGIAFLMLLLGLGAALAIRFSSARAEG